MKRLLVAIFLVLAWSTAAFAASRTTENVIVYRLHFGMGIGSQAVSPDVMRSFIAKEVTPRFPVGLTVFMARGQWASPDDGLVRESTAVVDVQCEEKDDAACKTKISEISDMYVKRFQKAKTSVFITRMPGVTTTLVY